MHPPPSLPAQVRAHYQAVHAQPAPGATPEQIDAFKTTWGSPLPRSVEALYRELDGLKADAPDFGFHTLQLWPLVELGPVPVRVAQFQGIPNYGLILDTLPDAQEYIAFGDGAVWSHVLAFKLTPAAGPVLWISGANFTEVAPSFDAFWTRYLTDPDSVLWPSLATDAG